MKINDQQFGRPQILYKSTKAQIEATPNPQPGMVAFATDINQMGIYTSSGWQWGSGGDMLKAVYDTDNDGVVDAAESVDWSGVQNKPSTYPPSSHQHDAGDVTSGVFDAARIPNLDASKITSGTLSTDRFSAFADLQAENKIGLVTGRIPDANAVRMYASPSEAHDFTSTTLPSGWQWAGSPFVPPSLAVVNGTFLRMQTNGNRAFLYSSQFNAEFRNIYHVSTVRASTWFGLRYDDGTDNNYIEVLVNGSADYSTVTVFRRRRFGGGSVVETDIRTMQNTLYGVSLNSYLTGTLYSNWNFVFQGWLGMDGFVILVNSDTASFTPARYGLVLYNVGGYRLFLDSLTYY